MGNQSQWVDIGVNLTNKQFTGDTAPLLERAGQAGIEGIVITGTHLEASLLALEIAKQYDTANPKQANTTPTLYTTAGVHPHDAKSWSSTTADELKAIASDPKVVAIGEAGLDFNRNFSTPDQQIRAFEQQLELASELQRPLFLHQRDAHDRLYATLKAYRDQLGPIVIHCFTDTQKALFQYLDLDCHIGITGWICDERRGQSLQKMVHNIPLNRLMLETDAPYLLPRDLENRPPNKRNEPQWLPHIGATVARLYQMPAAELASSVFTTTCDFFSLALTNSTLRGSP